jgi:ketosteroid isomerase-like protein
MPVSESILKSMRETNERFCSEFVRQRNASALDRVYTADAHILPPGVPAVHGREDIKQFWEQAVAQLNVEDARLVTVEAEMAGDRVVEIGSAELDLTGGQTAAAKYVVVWKQEDGGWRWHIDIWNMNS